MRMSDVWIHPDIAYFLGPQGVSPQSEGLRYPGHIVRTGLGAEASTSTKTTHFRRSGNEWFSHFVYTNALRRLFC